MPYKPIEDYGMIGDMHTVALVATDGSIDWLCVPNFDSPSVFAAILDDEKGGCFKIAPAEAGIINKQFYWPETNVLVTRFLAPHGAAELTDFMPAGRAVSGNGHFHQIIRRVTAVRGSLTFRMSCHPAFNYARDPHTVTITEDGAIFASPSLSLGLASATTLEERDGGIVSDFTLAEGESAVFVLRHLSDDSTCGLCLSSDEGEDLFRKTVDYWRNWIGQCQYTGRWREMVHRSALALKLMTFEPTGAIVAAPTCSLPEDLGGERNWDYRYTWIRDSAFTAYAFLRLGFTDEAESFMQFLAGLCKSPGPDGGIQIMYGIDGRKTLTEETLDHLDGYMGSKPVRIGNGAYDQLQLDIYGELLDAAYLYNKYGAPISYDLWTSLRALADWVCDNWRRRDEGVWEVRGGQQEFVYSKLMCWVALDRAIRLADKRSFPAPRDRWLAVRDEIYEDIIAKGWSEKRQAFVQHYGSDSLDAANLMMALTFFMSPADPRMLKTLDATLQPPEKGGLTANSLVYRYNVEETKDGLDGEEGTFNICTFWLVEALTRAGLHDRARLEEGRLIFERMLGFANHVGLYAEETGPHGEGLGNFPQAFTHLALISAAFNLDRALGPGA
ncbi:MAG: glycoside hydrolase family 15 protein [Alphaproteobacteria bacterium]|nr:glycoside hydrolase family 15 protein [Alphaproteobacteria bacterium]